MKTEMNKKICVQTIEAPFPFTELFWEWKNNNLLMA